MQNPRQFPPPATTDTATTGRLHGAQFAALCGATVTVTAGTNDRYGWHCDGCAAAQADRDETDTRQAANLHAGQCRALGPGGHRWEYQVTTITGGRQVLRSELNMSGADGWELVTCEHLGAQREMWAVVLKRPVGGA